MPITQRTWNVTHGLDGLRRCIVVGSLPEGVKIEPEDTHHVVYIPLGSRVLEAEMFASRGELTRRGLQVIHIPSGPTLTFWHGYATLPYLTTGMSAVEAAGKFLRGEAPPHG